MPNGAELFVQAAAQLGIREIFTLVGDHLNEVLGVAARAGMRIIDMRHESGVTHAADAWARLTRRPQMSLVTGGPGHTNSLTGIATAQLSASPLIAVSGSRSSVLAERQAFQDIDQVGMARPVAKWAAEVPAASQIPFYLGRAYAEADSGRRGAVHLTVPVDTFLAKADAPARLPGPANGGAASPSAADIERAIALLRSAQRPAIIAGSGVWWDDAGEELRRFVELTSIPLYTITLARGVVSDEHPLCMGYADPAMNEAALAVFQQADVILVLGKRIDYRLALGGPRLISPQAKVIQVDIHAPELGMNRALELGVCASVKATLSAMCDAAGAPWPARPWLAQVANWRDQWRVKLAAVGEGATGKLHPAAFFRELRRCLPRDVVYSWDGGDFAHWGRATLPALRPGRWLRLGPLGTIGSALPNAVALKMAYPDEPAMMITGDGSLGFYIAEFDSLVRHKLPVVIVVGNDAGWGLERELQQAEGAAVTTACELAPTRYDIVMQGFGGGGETIDTLEQVRPALERAFASGVPYVLNVNIQGVRSPFTAWQIAGKKK